MIWKILTGAATALLGLAMGYAGASLARKRHVKKAVTPQQAPQRPKLSRKWDIKILDALQSQPCGTASSIKIAQLLGAPTGAITPALTSLFDRGLVTRVKIDGLYVYKAADPNAPAEFATRKHGAAPLVKLRILAFLKAAKGKKLYTGAEIAEKIKLNTSSTAPYMSQLFQVGCVDRIKNEKGIFVYEFIKDLPPSRRNTAKGGAQ